MQFVGYCTESEKDNGFLGTEWFFSVPVFYAGDCVAGRTVACRSCPASWEDHTTIVSLGKDQNSKLFEVCFLNAYHFNTIINSKNYKF